jgi:hypothetical protein
MESWVVNCQVRKDRKVDALTKKAMELHGGA